MQRWEYIEICLQLNNRDVLSYRGKLKRVDDVNIHPQIVALDRGRTVWLSMPYALLPQVDLAGIEPALR